MPSPLIDTSSQHNVQVWIEERTKAGALRSCANIEIKRVEDYRPDGLPYYYPACRENSFLWPSGPMRMNDRLQILQNGLHLNLISCPKDCKYFQSRFGRALSMEQKRFFSLLAKPFGYFSKLPWQTQTFIILLLILLWAPQWVPAITNLIRAMTGR
jgi:hypothetical protein